MPTKAPAVKAIVPPASAFAGEKPKEPTAKVAVVRRIEIPPSAGGSKRDWDRIDEVFYGLIRRANWAFLVNAYINILLVIIGVVLIAYALATAWIKGADFAAAFTGIGGIVAVVATFFVGPQERIPKHMGDLAQIQMLYRTYTLQADTFNDWVWYNEVEGKLTSTNLKRAFKVLEDTTRESCNLVEKLIGPEEKKSPSKGQA